MTSRFLFDLSDIFINVYEILLSIINVMIISIAFLLFISVCLYFRTMLNDLQNIFPKIDGITARSRYLRNIYLAEAIDFHCESTRYGQK